MNNSQEYIKTLENAAKGLEAMTADVMANFQKSFSGNKADAEAFDSALKSANVKTKVADIFALIKENNKAK